MIRPSPVRRTIDVNASPEQAFDIFTAGIGRWWPATHHIGAAEVREVRLEPEVGGRWFEVGADGSESDWGEVLVWEPPHRLLLAWRIGADFRFDPKLLTEVEVRFLAQGGRTRVELEHRHLERMGEGENRVREAFESPNGWGGVLSLYALEVETRR